MRISCPQRRFPVGRNGCVSLRPCFLGSKSGRDAERADVRMKPMLYFYGFYVVSYQRIVVLRERRHVMHRRATDVACELPARPLQPVNSQTPEDCLSL